eukprot:1005931_1
MINSNPVVVDRSGDDLPELESDLCILREEIFDIIRTIRDPEHLHTLEDLGVISEATILLSRSSESLKLSSEDCPSIHVCVEFRPTVPHCSLASLIGLSIREKLRRVLLRDDLKINLAVEKGTHAQEDDKYLRPTAESVMP